MNNAVARVSLSQFTAAGFTVGLNRTAASAQCEDLSTIEQSDVLGVQSKYRSQEHHIGKVQQPCTASPHLLGQRYPAKWRLVLGIFTVVLLGSK